MTTEMGLHVMKGPVVGNGSLEVLLIGALGAGTNFPVHYIG